MSRFKKGTNSEEVQRKREICRKCDYNSNNVAPDKVALSKRILKYLSDLYSKLAGKQDEDNLGNCLACDSCSIYYKTEDEDHCPHPNGDKWNSEWRSVYIQNKK